MSYVTKEVLLVLRDARERMGLSQRDLSARIGVPQSHISKIESGSTDLRLSSLVELARALDYELLLVPRKLLPAVEAIIGNASSTLAEDAHLRLSSLNRAQAAVAKLNRTHPDEPAIRHLDQTLRELTNFRLGTADIDTLRAVTDGLRKLPGGPAALPAIERASRQLRKLRNRVAHALPEAARPAYALDEDDEDA
jgi:transcriptional regulator with XRE-family HTH domain